MFKVDLDDVELDRAGFLKKSQVTMPVFSACLRRLCPVCGDSGKVYVRRGVVGSQVGQMKEDVPGVRTQGCQSEKTRRRLQGSGLGRTPGTCKDIPEDPSFSPGAPSQGDR